MKLSLNRLIKKNIIISICESGVLIALILITNYVFDLFKVWNWSIQVFLIIYAIGIYKIPNIVVNIFFLFVVPPLLFAMENGIWAINASQVFFEYFLVFYVFSLLYISKIISNLFKNKKNFKIIDYFIFIISFSILIIIKYFLHSIASLLWWNSKNYLASLIYNSSWLATNSLTILISIFVVFPIFELFEKINLEQKNKWQNY